MEGDCRSRHITSGVPLKASQPPESPRDAMASVTPSPGPSTLSAQLWKRVAFALEQELLLRLAQHEQPEPDVAYQPQDQKHRSDVPPEYQTQNCQFASAISAVASRRDNRCRYTDVSPAARR